MKLSEEERKVDKRPRKDKNQKKEKERKNKRRKMKRKKTRRKMMMKMIFSEIILLQQNQKHQLKSQKLSPRCAAAINRLTLRASRIIPGDWGKVKPGWLA